MSPAHARMATLLVDAHAHLHGCYDTRVFLDAAHANFEAAAVRIGAQRPTLGVLLLTESAGEDAFARLAASADRAGSAPRGSIQGGRPAWSFRSTAESCSLVAASGRRRLVLVAGRQVATADGFEVLVFGVRGGLDDGLPIEETLAAVRRLGAVHAIPWGAGKWMLGRGRLLSRLIRSASGREFCLGDEGGRPSFWRSPRHFAEAAGLGLRVLRGTDPLPFRREAARAGSFGFWLRRPVDVSRPAAAVLGAVRDPAAEIHDYGRLERPLPFLVNQLAMQRRKRARRPAARISDAAAAQGQTVVAPARPVAAASGRAGPAGTAGAA